MNGDINHRPSVAMDEQIIDGASESVRIYAGFELVRNWARYLEARLAKYETFAPSPKPGATIVTKHTAFDPDRRPSAMEKLDTASTDERPGSLVLFASGYSRAGASENLLLVYLWARHLESVREGLQAQLNKYERQEKQRLERELAQREADQRDRSCDH